MPLDPLTALLVAALEEVGRLAAELEGQRAMVLAVAERAYVMSRHLSVLAERKERRRA